MQMGAAGSSALGQEAPRRTAGFSWPVPPGFRTEATAAETESRGCTVELRNGNLLDGDLLAFDPDAPQLSLASDRNAAAHQISLASVRMIRLTSPLLARDRDQAGGADPGAAPHADEASFAVHFLDGREFRGITHGYLREKVGLFLYLPQNDPRQLVRCFVPASQFDDVQIEPLPAEAPKHDGGGGSVETPAPQPLAHAIATPGDLSRALRSQKRRPAMKLGELLLESRLITREQLADALQLQAANRSRRLGDILVEMGAVSARAVQLAMSDKLGIPFVSVREFPVDCLALDLVSAGVAQRYQALPLMIAGDSLVVAVENPLTMDFLQELRFLTGHIIVPVIANPDELRQRIVKEYFGPYSPGAQNGSGGSLPDGGGHGPSAAPMKVEDLATALERESVAPLEVRDSAADARVSENVLVRLVNKIITDAHLQGASDIHIESNSGKAKTRIRFRKDGELEDYLELHPAYCNALVSRLKIMANLDIAEHRHAQDGKIACGKFGLPPIELRVAVVPTANNLEDMVLRLLGGVEPLPLDKLGLSARDKAELKKMVSRSYGLILVCGPTGSGKTTTLHSVLHHINQPNIKIWTAEDPVEITQAGLRQVQINSHIDWTFAAAMRAFLRADPDVIMVGEMRDAETTKIGIEASLTGHLVFSTLHTNSAAESVTRLLELGMDPFNFADALIGILSQRLARKLCGKCKRARPASAEEVEELLHEYCSDFPLKKEEVLQQWHKDFATDGRLLLHEAVGCEACHEGYKGRLGIYELLSGTPEVKQLVRSRGTVPQIVQAGAAGGMRLLRQDAIEKVLAGQIDRISARASSS
jgi:type II secretory ATPase GspE/PulE/Tfp pilus assembly ATPase PilB-like protein